MIVGGALGSRDSHSKIEDLHHGRDEWHEVAKNTSNIVSDYGERAAWHSRPIARPRMAQATSMIA